MSGIGNFWRGARRRRDALPADGCRESPTLKVTPTAATVSGSRLNNATKFNNRVSIDFHDQSDAVQLRAKGVDVTTTTDAGLVAARDEDHMAFSRREGRVGTAQGLTSKWFARTRLA